MDPSYSSNIYIGSCAGCNKEIHGEGRVCHAMGCLFHDTCFICSVCSKKLSGKPFFTIFGRIFCDDDFLYSGVHPSPEVCSSCGYLIKDMVLQAHGKSYHPPCFRCVVCRQSLEGQPFSVDTDSRVYCVSDYQRDLQSLFE
ncbi:uncharacterized protein V6R79_016019 [Siganus canaliculatus]